MTFLARLQSVLGLDPDQTAHLERLPVDGPSRRGFLSALVGAGAVAATCDIEQALWMPGEKLIIEAPTAKIVEPEESILPLSGDSFRVGDVFTIANYMKINPRTLKESGVEQRFIVTAVTSSGPIFRPDASPLAWR